MRESLDRFQQTDPDLDHYEAIARTLRQLAIVAASLGQTEVYRLCNVRTRALGSGIACDILSQCLALLPQPAPEVLTIESLSQATGWSRTTIWRRRQEGTLPEARTEGGKLYWLRSDLQGIL
jgi:predicted DNA-binding transcriptional regulator AlpA